MITSSTWKWVSDDQSQVTHTAISESRFVIDEREGYKSIALTTDDGKENSTFSIISKMEGNDKGRNYIDYIVSGKFGNISVDFFAVFNDVVYMYFEDMKDRIAFVDCSSLAH